MSFCSRTSRTSAARALANVARGYARNFLIPRKLAEVATPGKIIEFQRREEERKARDARLAAQADEYTETLNKTVLTLSAKVGEGDRLFGSITAVDVADAIKAARGFAIDKRKVRLEEPIKEVGTFMVEVEVGDGFVATVKVIVTPRARRPPDRTAGDTPRLSRGDAAAEWPCSISRRWPQLGPPKRLSRAPLPSATRGIRPARALPSSGRVA